MPTLTAYVANCLISGIEVTHSPDGSWIRDIARFKCGKWEFRFRQSADVVCGKTEDFRGTFCSTTTVEVDDIQPSNLEEALAVLDGICWLLSFATESRVHCYGYHFPDKMHGHFKSTTGIANPFRPPFALIDTVKIKSFVEETYPAYCRLNKKRKLPEVFHYLLQTEGPGQPTEIRLLLLFVTLENLKDTYARTAGIPYIQGYYRKPSRKSGKIGGAFKFEELLSEMLRSVGMRRGLKQIVCLRNEIIHSGLSRKSHLRLISMYERIQDILREYVLRLLDYHGEFVLYASRGYAVKKI